MDSEIYTSVMRFYKRMKMQKNGWVLDKNPNAGRSYGVPDEFKLDGLIIRILQKSWRHTFVALYALLVVI